jgi:hypothetical protein
MLTKNREGALLPTSCQAKHTNTDRHTDRGERKKEEVMSMGGSSRKKTHSFHPRD